MEKFIYKKKYGQNFLQDSYYLEVILNNTSFSCQDLVIEIGCGSGILTKKILTRDPYFIGYEIDNDTKKYLDSLQNEKRIIIYDDFMKRSVIKDIKMYPDQKKYIIANLPYYITTAVISKIIKEEIFPEEMIFMVQYEVGQRLTAEPGTKDFSAITVILKYFYNIDLITKVPRKAFYPVPNVDSALIKLVKKDIIYNPVFYEHFKKVVLLTFRQKRKTLKNNLGQENIELFNQFIKDNKLLPTIRAEELTLEQFIALANMFEK